MEGHVVVQFVSVVRDAAAGAAARGPGRPRHVLGLGPWFRLVELRPDLLHAFLPSVLSSAASANADGHHEAAQDFKYAADETQVDAVASGQSSARLVHLAVDQKVGVHCDACDD